MSIDTNFNIDPYYDDYDSSKQYHRVLFKPSYAVQSRELTQLQTILQDQVERFGSNIYQEGTVITGINITERSDIRFVKLNDQFDFVDPTIYNPSDTTKYYITGQTSGLRAEILKAANGFQTQDPNLKTFYVTYLNSATLDNGDAVQEFVRGEYLKIEDQDGVTVTTTTNSITSDLRITVASVTDHVGPSYGVSTDEGYIYQKGHFIYAEPQFIIISKYTNSPSNVSVGFDIDETIQTASQDSSLYDPAQGSNNFNAPGADRLKLTPVLNSYFTTSAPDSFFALIRFQGGQPVLIRNVTQFNSIAEEMARRTYEESGNYIVSGMDVTLEQTLIGYGGTVTSAVVSPGKAYAFGYEVKNISPTKIAIDLVTEKRSKQNHVTGVNYGSYYEFDWNATANNVVLNHFDLDGTSYDLKDSGDAVIGSCRVKNIASGQVGGKGKIYVYAVKKDSGEEDTPVAKIEDTPVIDTIKKPNTGEMLFKLSNLGVSKTENMNVTRRLKTSAGATANVTLAGSATETPLLTNIVGVNASQNLVDVTSVTQNGDDVDIVFDAAVSTVYYDVIVNDLTRDTLTQKTVYVNTTVASGVGDIGLPNVLKILEVVDNSGAGDDVTNKFRLVNNQKDGYYDYSYIKLRPGQTLSNANVNVKCIVLERASNFGSSYLDAKSYDGVQKHLLFPHTATGGEVYDLVNTIDFRPYAVPLVAYAETLGTSGTVTSADPTFASVVAVANSSSLFYDFTYFLPRIDSVGVGSDGIIKVYKGKAAELPYAPKPKDAFVLAHIIVPGNIINLNSIKSPYVKMMGTRTYTMKDIENLDKQVSRLTEAVALTMLELETDNLFIPDENGLNRFKNGILADSFRDLGVADLTDPEYSSSVNRQNNYAAPELDQFQIDLKVAGGSSAELGFSDVVTLAHSGALVSFLSQPYATNTRRPSTGSLNYRGKTTIHPSYDAAHDLSATPDININILGGIVNTTTTNETIVEGDIVNYGASGINPYTRTANTYEDSIGSNDAGVSSGIFTNLYDFVAARMPVGGSSLEDETSNLFRGGMTSVVPPAYESTYIASKGVNINNNYIDGETTSLGPYITDYMLSPYVASRQVKIYATGLRPNTKHNFFFNDVYVSGDVYPGAVDATQAEDLSVDIIHTCSANGTKGSDIYSDDNGVLAAIFEIPEATFPTGESTLIIVDSATIADIASTATSYTQAKYRAFNFEGETQSVNATTRTLEIEKEINITKNTVTTNYNQVGGDYSDSAEVHGRDSSPGAGWSPTGPDEDPSTDGHQGSFSKS